MRDDDMWNDEGGLNLIEFTHRHPVLGISTVIAILILSVYSIWVHITNG